jgi:hypothetical protein
MKLKCTLCGKLTEEKDLGVRFVAGGFTCKCGDKE